MNYKIIDAHCHIFPDKIVEKAVKNIGDFYGISMNETGKSEELYDFTKSLNYKKIIVSSTATTCHQVEAINNFILSQLETYSCFVGLITLHPDLSTIDIDKNIKFALDHNFKGIKLHPDFQKFFIDDKKAYKIYEAAEGVLPILFHTGDDRYEESSPQRLMKIAKKFKNLKCIAAHFGGYSRWNEVLGYTETPNVFFDTSSSLFKLNKNDAISILEKLGYDRFMFGTDYPMWNPKEEIERFLNLQLSSELNKKIFYDNALKIYNLK